MACTPVAHDTHIRKYSLLYMTGTDELKISYNLLDILFLSKTSFSTGTLLEIFLSCSWAQGITCRIPYTYKFSRDVNFADLLYSGFSRFYFWGSLIWYLLLTIEPILNITNFRRWKIHRWPDLNPQNLHPLKICTYMIVVSSVKWACSTVSFKAPHFWLSSLFPDSI